MTNSQTTPPEYLEGRPSPRDLIEWLALFVAPMCKTRNDTLMYMNVRDQLIEKWGMR